VSHPVITVAASPGGLRRRFIAQSSAAVPAAVRRASLRLRSGQALAHGAERETLSVQPARCRRYRFQRPNHHYDPGTTRERARAVHLEPLHYNHAKLSLARALGVAEQGSNKISEENEHGGKPTPFSARDTEGLPG